MLKPAIFTALFLVCLSCQTQQFRDIAGPTVPEYTADRSSTSTLDDQKVVESYADDQKIGRRKRNKVEIDIVENTKSVSDWKPDKVVAIRFFSLSDSAGWMMKQAFQLPSHAIGDADPQFADFNGDGLEDLTFISETAARGANVIRTLLIYDKISDSLVHIQNSDDYPNLSYNRKLHCIDSWMFHAATTTVFLKLENDRLREFASVDTGPEFVVTVTDKSGNERELRREKMREDDIYTRYSTFDPPRP